MSDSSKDQDGRQRHTPPSGVSGRREPLASDAPKSKRKSAPAPVLEYMKAIETVQDIIGALMAHVSAQHEQLATIPAQFVKSRSDIENSIRATENTIERLRGVEDIVRRHAPGGRRRSRRT